MLTARAAWVAGCLAIAAIAAIPSADELGRAAEQPRKLPAGCDERVWDKHLGRVALYSMYPKGPLTPTRGASPRFEYRDGGPRLNTYEDVAGVTWVLYPDWQNDAHEPQWWDGEGANPNKKFVARDTRGGSFEAILQPDGRDTWSTQAGAGPIAYDALNWLRDKRGIKWIGTYNYYDATEWYSQPGLQHLEEDYLPHLRNSNYAPIPAGLSELDPATVRWRTYVPRAEVIVALFARERGTAANGEKMPPARLASNGGQVVIVHRELVHGALSDPLDHAVDPDLVPLAEYLARCLGEDDRDDCEKLADELVLLTEAGRRHSEFIRPEDIANQHICHDLTGDGRDDVAFAISGGGSGGSFELAVFVARPDAEEDAPLDRRFRELRVDFYDAKTTLEREGERLVTRNPIFNRGDANCCPTGGQTRRTYEVTPTKLVLVRRERLP